MPELDTITVKGFKSIASIEKLKLGAINVIVGPNGSGKSNFIGVFSFLHAIREGHLQDHVIKAGGRRKGAALRLEGDAEVGTSPFLPGGDKPVFHRAGADRCRPIVSQWTRLIHSGAIRYVPICHLLNHEKN